MPGEQDAALLVAERDHAQDFGPMKLVNTSLPCAGRRWPRRTPRSRRTCSAGSLNPRTADDVVVRGAVDPSRPRRWAARRRPWRSGRRCPGRRPPRTRGRRFDAVAAATQEHVGADRVAAPGGGDQQAVPLFGAAPLKPSRPPKVSNVVNPLTLPVTLIPSAAVAGGDVPQRDHAAHLGAGKDPAPGCRWGRVLDDGAPLAPVPRSRLHHRAPASVMCSPFCLLPLTMLQ